jgi:threonylcarbamoyladenosine tRNA methylthiotransferase CDKAL1
MHIKMKAKKLYIEDNMCTIYKLVIHKMQNILLDNGYRRASTPFDADILLAGVCAAFDADQERSTAIVEKMIKIGKPLFVYGCMTQVNPERLDTPLIYASWQADALIRQLTNGNATFSYEESLPDTFRIKSDYRVYNPKKRFIGIATGCSFECSYCPHKKGAGNIRSIAQADIINMVARAIDSGAETLVLTGIDTACYGSDIGTSYHAILSKILLSIDRRTNIHIAQFNPEGLFRSPAYTQMMIDLWSDPRIKDIQLPIQTGSHRLLALMNRHYSMDSLDTFLWSLKRKNPTMMLRTDLLIGFPTETIEEIDLSIAFAIRHYSEVALYVFEMKQGTPISNMDLPTVLPDEAQQRLQYASQQLRAAGLLVHSGGQRIETLLKNDRIKETLTR